MIQFTCYMILSSGAVLGLNDGVLCPEISSPYPPAPVVIRQSDPIPLPPPPPVESPNEQFIDAIFALIPGNGALYDAIFSDALDPLAQGYRVCAGQPINEAQPATLNDDDWLTYQSTVRVLAQRYLC